MSDAVFRRESAVEYFKELVDGALAHQGIAARRAHGVLRRAAADRLSAAAGRTDDDDARWRSGWREALERGGVRQRDEPANRSAIVSLFISGFFCRFVAAQARRRRLLRQHRRHAPTAR